MKISLPDSAKNWVSLVGATIALIALFLILFLFVISLLMGQNGLYLGLITYILLPGVLIAGLLLIPLGMAIRVKKLKSASGARPGWPVIDLSNVKHRHAFFIFFLGTALFLFLSAIGNYQAFHYTESVQFCGTLCHKIMQPEYTAYRHSSHAKLRCVSCHVGPGASWFVRSKLSGLHQVVATVTNSYPRPIETPIKNLRPARVVCEQCHWPQKFYARTLRHEAHFIPDEHNTRWDIGLVMKIGPQQAAHGLREGIHWHINPNVRIQYYASNKKRTDIPLVRYINLKSGDTLIYKSTEESIGEKNITASSIRTMDCIDCHTRPSHNYRSPSHFLNTALASGAISPGLPEIKSAALDILGQEFGTSDSLSQAIRVELEQFYAENYPDVLKSQRTELDSAIRAIQQLSTSNIFPEMKVRWDTHVNNIGHMEFKGCFRCHDDHHVSQRGGVISKKCDLCHLIQSQGRPGGMETVGILKSLEFKHPVDIGGAWKTSLCSECHTGLNP